VVKTTKIKVVLISPKAKPEIQILFREIQPKTLKKKHLLLSDCNLITWIGRAGWSQSSFYQQISMLAGSLGTVVHNLSCLRGQLQD